MDKKNRSFSVRKNERQHQGKNLEDIEAKDIQKYVLHLKQEKELAPGTINTYITSIRFFYTYVLEKDWHPKRVPRMKNPRKLPVIPPREDILALIDATTNLKHKAFLLLIYGSGLRVSEVVNLKIKDICSRTMRVRIETAKQNTVRYSILSETSLHALRDYYRADLRGTGCTPEDWLFPGQKPNEPLNVKTIKNTIIKLRDRLKLDSRISAHTLRHCFATHLLENGVDPVIIQQLLGHKQFSTTSQYLHLTSKHLMKIESPLDSYIGV